MPRFPSLLAPLLAAALWPHPGQAQEGPSFDCRYAQTATEHAICASPGLSELERRTVQAYQQLVNAVGERKARRIADRFLERRQACGANEACIARRLEISMRVFERRAGGDTRLASREPSNEELDGLDATAPDQEVASAEPRLPDRIPSPMAREDLAPASPPAMEPVASAEPTSAPEAAPADKQVASAAPATGDVQAPSTNPDVPLAAQAPLPDDLDPLLNGADDQPANAEPASNAEVASAAPDTAPAEAAPAAPPATDTEVASAAPAPSPDQLDQTIAGAELASSDEAAPFDQPISWAFMNLIRHQRAEIQARLQAAGYYEGPAQGSWDRATLDAFDAFFASDEGKDFDPSTESGAALALDYIRSDAFAQSHGIAAADPSNPVTSTQW